MASYRNDSGGGGGFTPIDVPYAASIVLDLSRAAKPLFRISMTGSANVSAINGSDGQEWGVFFTQAAGGGHSVSWDSGFRGSGDTPLPSLSSGLGASDYFGFMENLPAGKHDHLAPNKGFT